MPFIEIKMLLMLTSLEGAGDAADDILLSVLQRLEERGISVETSPSRDLTSVYAEIESWLS